MLGLPEDDSPKLLAFLPLGVSDDEGEPTGRLLSSWERLPETTTWVYHLRTDVRWHDGARFTARDVLFTLRLKEEVGWQSPGRSDAELVDDSTFSVTYHRMPYGGLLHLNDWEVYYPQHLLERMDTKQFGEWDYWLRPVGNGPYRFVRRVRGTLIELEANPDYCCGELSIQRIILRLGTPSLPVLLSGEVDAMPIDLLGALKLMEDDRFRVHYSVNGGDRLSLVWNLRNPTFADRRVRRALIVAIERPELHRVLNLRPDLPISDVVFTREQYVRGEIGAALPYDPGWASRLLAEAGWVDADGDGIRERGQERLGFTAIVGPESRSAAVFVQQQLRRVGVEMRIEPRQTGSLIQSVHEGEFDAALYAVHTELRGQRGLVSLFGAASGLGYQDPRVLEILGALEQAILPAEIDSLYRELQPIFAAETPVAYLAPRVGAWAVSRRVRGLEGMQRPDPFLYVARLWLEEEPPVRPAE
ncbi:MAG: ABC transporter substrate-binding protein [Gemmatimonadota bacterium]